MKTHEQLVKEYEDGCSNVDKDLFPIKDCESIGERYVKTSQLIVGYNQNYAVWRALGFKTPFEVSLHPISTHVMNKDDLKNSVLWLLSNGYDIIKKKP